MGPDPLEHPLFNPTRVMEFVAAAFGVDVDRVLHARHTRQLQLVRRVCALLLRETGYYSWADVARILEYGDHTSARSGVQVLRDQLAEDPALTARVDALRVQLRIHLPEGG